MSFLGIAPGTTVFLDANVFIYAFGPDPQLGPPCEKLLERIEFAELQGVTSSHVLSDVAHRLMSLEACATYGWPYAGIAVRMHRHPDEVTRLSHYRRALDVILAIGVTVLPIFDRHVISGTDLSRQYGLLSNDALIVAVMREHAVTQLASHDADFDRVPGITRFDPA